MTEVWTCTDCGSEIDFDTRHDHMKDEHGVTYSIPEAVCPGCGEQSCERAKELEGT